MHQCTRDPIHRTFFFFFFFFFHHHLTFFSPRLPVSMSYVGDEDMQEDVPSNSHTGKRDQTASSYTSAQKVPRASPAAHANAQTAAASATAAGVPGIAIPSANASSLASLHAPGTPTGGAGRSAGEYLPEIAPDEIEMERLIGEGSFGKVMQGRCRQKPVAVKILHKQSFDAKTLEAFRKEVAMCSLVFHPNICLFMGACTQPGHCMIVTELVAKGDLETMLHDTSQHLSLTLRLKMARDAALGMNWLHGSTPKFIHRDLKCLARDTPVLLASGAVKLVQHVVAGDALMGDDGTPRRVSQCTRGVAPLARIESAVAPPLTCNTVHVLSLKLDGLPALRRRGDGTCAVDFVTVRRKRDGTVASMRAARRILRAAPDIADKRKLRAVLRVADEPLALDEPVDIAVEDVLDRKKVSAALFAALRTYGVEAPVEFVGDGGERDADRAYRAGLSACGALPAALLRGSVAARRALLAGVVDAAASFDVRLASAALAADVTFVARSLGVVAAVRRDDARRVQLGGAEALRVPVRRRGCGRPVAGAAAAAAQREPLRITALACGEFFGFELDGNRRFVLGDSFRVTHNTSNLLVDENMRIKVCDFGLSQMLADGEVARDQKSAKGTPLWMAPEVMMFRGFTEKCDIYSFGIVLWEILTRQEPFKEFHSFKEFRDAICKRHVRPPIPEDTLPSLRDLIERAWHPDPNQRPDFTYIVAALDDIIVESAITDNLGRAFWKAQFLKRDPIPWAELLPAFLLYLGVPDDATAAIVSASAAAVAAQQAPNSAAAAQALAQAQSVVSGNLPEFHAVQLSIACLRLLVCDFPNSGGGGGGAGLADTALVPIEKFGKVLDCFSPVSGAQVLDEIQALCAETWFHGHVSTPEAQTRLANTPAGCFLVRFSSQEHGSYTISLVTPAGAIRHQRVRHVGNAFLLQNQRYPSLRAVVELGGHLLNLLIPCPGSTFGAIFASNPHPILGYEEISWSPTNDVNHE
jgi:serine/threonine protein kinase